MDKPLRIPIKDYIMLLRKSKAQTLDFAIKV